MTECAFAASVDSKSSLTKAPSHELAVPRSGRYLTRMVGPAPNSTHTVASERYRARADERRVKAESFRDPKARAQMLQLAADYDRKAVQAEAFEAHTNENKPV